METTIKKPRTANIAPETQQILADKMNSYFRRFGVTKDEQKKGYSKLPYSSGIFKEPKKGTPHINGRKYSFATLYKFALQGEVSVKSTVDVLHYFGYEYCKKTRELESVIKHMEHGK